MVDPPEVPPRGQPSARGGVPRRRKQVVDAHLGVRLGRQLGQHPVLAGRVDVVDEQAHAHSPARGVAKGANEPLAGPVLREHVVLHVERLLRLLGQLQPRAVRDARDRHQLEAGRGVRGQ